MVRIDIYEKETLTRKGKKMEKAIVSNLIRKILRYGYAVNIDNGGDSYELPQPTTSFETICKEIGATGHDNLILFRNWVGNRSLERINLERN